MFRDFAKLFHAFYFTAIEKQLYVAKANKSQLKSTYKYNINQILSIVNMLKAFYEQKKKLCCRRGDHNCQKLRYTS